MRAWLIGALSLGLGLGSGCAFFRPGPPRMLDPGLGLLSPAAAGVDLSVTQSLRFSKGDKHFEALAALEVDAEHLSLAALGPLGNRMLALSWDGKKLQAESDPSLPPELPLKLVLRDVEMAFWPLAAWRAKLPKGWSMEEKGNERLLSKDGQLVLRIHYGGPDRWHSPLKFEQISLGYALEISPIKEDE